MSAFPPVEEGEFRLFRIKTVSFGIVCESKTMKIEEEPDQEYVALSYAWEDDGQRRAITVNDLVLEVTTTLYHAIRELHRRDEFRHSWFWIDQICIDQSNNYEKSKQVPNMAEIYSFAKQVAIWLGPA